MHFHDTLALMLAGFLTTSPFFALAAPVSAHTNAALERPQINKSLVNVSPPSTPRIDLKALGLGLGLGGKGNAFGRDREGEESEERR